MEVEGPIGNPDCSNHPPPDEREVAEHRAHPLSGRGRHADSGRVAGPSYPTAIARDLKAVEGVAGGRAGGPVGRETGKAPTPRPARRGQAVRPDDAARRVDGAVGAAKSSARRRVARPPGATDGRGHRGKSVPAPAGDRPTATVAGHRRRAMNDEVPRDAVTLRARRRSPGLRRSPGMAGGNRRVKRCKIAKCDCAISTVALHLRNGACSKPGHTSTMGMSGVIVMPGQSRGPEGVRAPPGPRKPSFEGA